MTKISKMADVEKKIEGKLRLLEFNVEQTQKIIDSADLKAIERHVSVLESIIEKIHELKLQYQEIKIENGEDASEVRVWTEAVETKLGKFEHRAKDVKHVASEIKYNEKEQLAEQKRKQVLENEIQLEKAKLEVRSKFEASPKSSSVGGVGAKLPKLVISKFQGTYLDWVRFWNQFETEIDKTTITQVAKLSYLRELLIPSAQVLIEGLPFSSEGYERAKTILKTKYGQTSEVVNAHIQCIMGLPKVQVADPGKVYKFYETLASHVQTLETLGKLKEIGGFVRATLDKLPAIRPDLVRLDDEWQQWGFPQLVESLRKWCDRNLAQMSERSSRGDGHNRGHGHSYQASLHQARVCVYCDAPDHKAMECKKVPDVRERRKILSEKRLCFNCTGSRHQAKDCKSKYNCQKCGGQHHTSICVQKPGKEQMLVATGESTVIYPVVVISVDGIKCRALLDSGSGSSYASSSLIENLNKKPTRTEHKHIEMMVCSTTQKVHSYKVNISSVDENFEMSTMLNKVDKSVLLTIPNPGYEELSKKYNHLEQVVMNDNDTKQDLPIHVILGASDYSRVKTETKPKIGQSLEPIAEFTRLGWTVMSAGTESSSSNTYTTRTSGAEYQELCSLDVLGLKDRPEGDQQVVYEEFAEQLSRNEDGRYETNLLWKPGHGTLPTNERGSIKRLDSLVKKLVREPEQFEKYDNIIQEQLNEGIVERAVEEPQGREYYIPHKSVIKETAETTKMRIVFDASAKESDESPSLNDCLETGPPLQNLLWNVLVRNRLKPIALAADLKKAFLQVLIRAEDRDVLRFHWIRNKDPSDIEVLRFTRALFGLVQSPFLLAATLKQHLKALRERYPQEIDELEKCLYVDDIISGGCTSDEVLNLKQTTISVFEEAKFELHKWHSNEPQLESAENEKDPAGDNLPSYAKQQLGVNSGETKLLGLSWNKTDDTLAVAFPKKPVERTKREILRFLASVYDPLGIVSPVTLLGKFIFREVCDQNLPWDEKISDNLGQQWLKFLKYLPEKVQFARSIPRYREPLNEVELHTFGDASGSGVSAVVYVVVKQLSGESTGLIASKSRLAKKNLTIPRLELVSAHMAANLAANVRTALEGYPVSAVYGWLDSLVALHWIRGGGTYKQFVFNRVRKINEKDFITWRHVGTDLNPADRGSRGCEVNRLTDEWLNGPDWLTDPDKWPASVMTEPNKDSEAEAKKIRETLATAVEMEDRFDTLLVKHPYWKTIRVNSWIARFVRNCKTPKHLRTYGPLTTAETEQQVKWWIRRVQERNSKTEKFREDQLTLNLQRNSEGIYECRGRIQGSYPVYLPPKVTLSEKIVQDAHELTLHGGVGLTMALVRRDYWIPRLRQLVRSVYTHCYGCKKFHTTAFHKPPPGNLPVERTEGSSPFQVVGVDYAGPMAYKVSKKKEGKAYILLCACSLSRAIHLEMLTDQITEGFIRCLKRIIARRGRPSTIYSDNGKSFVAAAKWLKAIMKEEKLQDYLAHHNIEWKFNLAKAPWWGGQFERLIGVMKQALYKSIGRAVLYLNELEEVLLDVEIAVNNRPLSYVEDDVQLPILTPNLMMYGQSNVLPETEVDSIKETELRKRARHLRRCKDVLWSRWTSEYVRDLRERHNLKHKSKRLSLKVGDVVLMQSELRNRGKWNIGVVVKLIKGRDGEIRGARLRAGKSYMERAVQLLCPMELSCDIEKNQGQLKGLDPESKEFTPKRAAAEIAKERIRDVLAGEAADA